MYKILPENPKLKTKAKTGLRIDQIERRYAGGTMFSLLNVDINKTEHLKNSLFKAVTEIY